MNLGGTLVQCAQAKLAVRISTREWLQNNKQ